MALFQFGRKVDAARDYSLEEIPVFSSLTPAEYKLIEKKSRLIEFKRGDEVYKEGTAAEAFYVVVSGRFRLYSKARGKDETLAFFHRNDHFGETSLLTGRLHSGTLEAKHDGIILRISQEDFLQLIKDIPSLSLHLSRSLGHRLTESIQPGNMRRGVKIAALYSQSQDNGVSSFWLDLAAVIRNETRASVVVVDFVTPQHAVMHEQFRRNPMPCFDFVNMEPSRDSDLKSALLEHPRGYFYIHAPLGKDNYTDKDERKISTLLTFLTYQFNYLLLRLPADIAHLSFKVLKQSDYIYAYSHTDAASLGRMAEAMAEFQKSFGFSKSEIKLMIPEEETHPGISYDDKEILLGVKIFQIVPSKTLKQDRYESSLRFLAKELAGTLLGLVLGSGAAYGLAHIGVLRVLEQEGITVDVIAGSSMGSLIGAFWAAGYSASQLQKLAQSFEKKTGLMQIVNLADLSVAHRGFLKGKQVTKFMQSYLGNRTFQDLKIPVKIAAVDLFTSEEIIFDTGSVVDALRASISIPGIFRPFYHKGRYLIDGGVINPLPVNALVQMGVKKIIAVNVLASPKDRIESNRIRSENRRRELEEKRRRGVWSKIMAGSMNEVHNRYAVNIFNVIMNTVQFMEYEIADTAAEQADVLIHPVVSEGHWAEFYSPEKFIKIGEEKTREQIEDIKRLLVE